MGQRHLRMAASSALLISWLCAMSCGVGDPSLGPQQAFPLAKRVGADRTILDVEVTQNGSPIAGIEVEFARSVSGRIPDYSWIGWTGESETTEDGFIEVQIHEGGSQFWRTGASGYYLARATDPNTGSVLGRWGSIPVNGGERRCLFLRIGERARYVDPAMEDDVRESVFRYMMTVQEDTYAPLVDPSFFCLTLGRPTTGARIDPSPRLLARFSEEDRPARTLSQCEMAGPLLVDRETGLAVVHLDASRMVWLAPDSVAVDGTFLVRSGLQKGYTYHLSMSGGHWTVTDLTNAWAT